MENQMFKNKIVPWQNKGRWYEFFIESDGTDYTLTLSPSELGAGVAISGSYLKFDEGWHIIDYVCDIHVDTSSATTFEKGLRMYADGSQGCVLPDKTSFDAMYMWVFVNKEQD